MRAQAEVAAVELGEHKGHLVLPDDVRDPCTQVLRPEYLATQEAISKSLSSAKVWMDAIPANAARGWEFCLQLLVMFDPRSGEHEALLVEFWWGACHVHRIRHRLGELFGSLVQPDDQLMVFTIGTGRGAELSSIGPVYPFLVESGQRREYVLQFLDSCVRLLRTSRPLIVRALRMSQPHPEREEHPGTDM